MRPTLRLVLLAAAGLPVSLGATLIDPRLWPAWVGYLAGILLLGGVDALLGLPRRRLVLEAEAPDTLYMGDSDPLILSLRARGWRRTARLELLVDLGAELEPVAPGAAAVAPGQVARVELPLIARRRGTAHIEAVWLRWRGPFGLMRRTLRRPLGVRVAVVPNLRAVRAAALRFFSNRDFLSGLKVEHYLGDGSEFESLREYMPGLDHRAIDWKASARHKKLLCQEFRAERNHQVVVSIDTGHLMSEPLGSPPHVPDTLAGSFSTASPAQQRSASANPAVGLTPRLDHAINAGLMLSYFSLRTGDRVGLFAFDDKVRVFAEPAAGMGAFARLQRLTADLEYGTGETNFTLGLANLAARLRRRSLVVLLTEFVDVVTAELMLENVQRLAAKHLVVFVALRDPLVAQLSEREPRSLGDLHRAVVAGDMAREREAVLGRLRRLGVLCIDAPPDRLSMSLLNRYLDVIRRELI